MDNSLVFGWGPSEYSRNIQTYRYRQQIVNATSEKKE